MSTNTPFHQDNTNPPQQPYPPVEPSKGRKPVPIWAWAVGVVLVVLIVAGSIVLGNKQSEEPTPAPAVTVTETAQPEPTVTPKAAPTADGLTKQDRRPVAVSEADFLAFLREEYPVLMTVSDEEIMSFSDLTCDTLDEGATPEEVMYLALAGAESPEQASALGAITGGSVSNYCPEHYVAFAKFLDSQGVAVES